MDRMPNTLGGFNDKKTLSKEEKRKLLDEETKHAAEVCFCLFLIEYKIVLYNI